MPDNLPVAPNEKEAKLIDGILEGLTVQQASLDAGYSESFSKSLVYHKLGQASFVDKITTHLKAVPKARKNLALLRTPQLARIEQNILDTCETDTEFAATKGTKTIEREYRHAGMLKDEHGPSQPIIHVQVLANNLALNLDAPQGGNK